MADQARLDLLLDGLLHPGEVDRFVASAIDTPASHFPALADRVVAHLAQVEARAATDPAIDVEVARRIAAVLDLLLGEPEAYDADARALIRGAVEYFVLDGDDDADTTSGLGFDDDARVLNAALAALGRSELRVEP